MHLLKQSTASTVLVGPVMDSAGAAVTTGPVIADFTLTKNGTAAALASAATATHSHNGHWLIALTTGNTDTAGRAAVTVNNASYAMPAARFSVLPGATFDALVANAAGVAGGLVLSDANNRVDVGKVLGVAVDADKTAQAVASGSITLANTETYGTNAIVGRIIHVPSATTGAGQQAVVTAYNASTFVATVLPAWPITPTGAVSYRLLDSAYADVRGWQGAAPTGLASGKVPAAVAAGDVTGNLPADVQTIKTQAVTAAAGVTFPASVGTSTYAGGAVASVTGNVGGSVAGSVASVTGNVGGNVTGSVASVTAPVTAGTVTDKGGYALAATGLNLCVATVNGATLSALTMVGSLYRRFYGKATLTGTQLKTFADDGTTVLTTQAVSDDGTTQTQGPAA